ncbi:MAG: glutamine--fructose-6-phosphate transaminase (isomerizing), partial [Methylococcales bacterium]|nr:glutamine--fructose-6-phosphate transaminase (isomerizing) [Methylococcales bacterium]MBT4347425.1 glutamine--fructose-6-phosphate transaminase (isomerizing) [Methylococcales bacterium]
MCGIVGAVTQRDTVPILLEGLSRLEYRGYDSAGLAVIADNEIHRNRQIGKVSQLKSALRDHPVRGQIGIAHTRWATHGKPSIENAHPHICQNRVAIVHNGIIENHEPLRKKQQQLGYHLNSETDSEVIVNEIVEQMADSTDLLVAVKKTLKQLTGAYALGVIARDNPEQLIACRKGSPLVIGIGIGEYFIASDIAALLPVTQRFIFLEDGDIAELSCEKLTIYNAQDEPVDRPIQESKLNADIVGKGSFRHFMLKEIYEQPQAIEQALAGRIIEGRLNECSFGHNASEIFNQIKSVQILACGTSYHAGLVARYWFEKLARVPCSVEVASEFRYRYPIIDKDTLIVTLSQSGETADTLAALQEAKRLGATYSLAICNVPESSLVRESDLVMLTNAGPEIGVASTKAFTTQLAVLYLLVIAIGRRFDLDENLELKILSELMDLPKYITSVLQLDDEIKQLAERFSDKNNALFLGRGSQFPIAMEGALKLKEISYIHAEAYPAGELKHGPLALIDNTMPVITVAPNNSLLEKLRSNIQEVSARGGQLIVFMDEGLSATNDQNMTIIKVTSVVNELAPLVYSIPLQLLAYHVAVLKGTDVDQPRNLAKSVT